MEVLPVNQMFIILPPYVEIVTKKKVNANG